MSSFDQHKNLAASLVDTPPSPGTSGTTLSVVAGTGAIFPAAPFNCTVSPNTDPPTYPTLANSEIIRVTSKGSGDNWTILRAQEGTTARDIASTDIIANTITVKALTDIEAAVGSGDVVGPSTAVDGDVTLFDGTTGKLIKDGGTPAAFVASTIHAATGKTTPVDADEIPLVDSAAGNALKKGSWANIKAALKAYFDPLYQATITFGSGVLTALGVNVGTAGSIVVNGGALGTPSSGVATNLTGTAAGLTAGNVTTNANLTGPITSSGNATSVANDINLPGNPTATTQPPGTANTTIATMAALQTAILQGPAKEAVKYASTGALPSIIYANGSSGVGATLTGVALAAISLDSSSPAVADRVLIKNQASSFQNGIYVVTATGSGAAVFVLTRATDFDQSTDVKTGASVFVTAGSTLASTTWDVNSADNPVMGTDAITFTQTAGPGSVTSGNGITVTGASIAIDTSITLDKTTSQTLTNKTLTGPILTGPILGTPASGNLANCTFPTLNQNTTGSAASVSVTGQSGLITFVGLASTNRVKTVRDAADTILELGGSYTPTGTWTSLTMVTPVLGTPTSGNLTNCTADGTNSVGFLSIPQNSKSAAYTTVLADAGKHLYHPSADTTARIWTIDSNANVAYPIGTTLTFVNDSSAGVITIAITSDTLVLAGAGTTGSRTLAANGIATAIKMTATRWQINGTGLT